MNSVVQRAEKYAKTLAIDLRKKGLSYSEIRKSIFVSKSTLSYWLKNLNLTEVQVERLKSKRLDAARAGSEKKKLNTAKAIEKIKTSSAKDIKKISNRELWLMGVMLYWRERFLRENESDLRKGVRFTSSDPYLIKLFLKWLRDIGRIKNDEIGFDIFVTMQKEKNEIVTNAINYWAEITQFSKTNFTHVYFQKLTAIPDKNIRNGRRIKKRNIRQRAPFGLLRIRVKASSMLARQIAGWIKGIQDYYWR